MKQWEKDLESERDATDDDEGSRQRLLRIEEQDRRSSVGLGRKLLGDSQSSMQGMRRESREIYRRISDDSTHPPSDDQKKPAEAAKGGVQKLEKTKEEEEPKARAT